MAAHWWTYLALGTLVMLVFSNSLFCDFTFDDNSAVVSNVYIRSNQTSWWSVFLVDYWGTPIHSEHSHKSYRPLTLLSFRLNYALDGLRPFGYHLLNTTLHLVVSLIIYKFMCNIFSHNIAVSMFATLFFALHPLKSEAVSGIVGRAEIMLTMFYMISLFCYFDSAYLSFFVYVTCAILTKEQGITIPCICIVFEAIAFLNYRRATKSKSFLLTELLKSSNMLRVIMLIATIVILGLARFIVMGSSLPVFTKFDNPASMEDTPTRQLTYNYLVAMNVKLLLFPLQLCADWTMNSIPLVTSFDDFRNLETLSVYLIVAMLLIRSFVNLNRTSPESKNPNDHVRLLLALTLMIVPFLPASNLFFPVGFVIAERVLYTPSIGYSLLLAVGLDNLLKIVKRKLLRALLYSFAVLTLVSLAGRTYMRNFDWTNDLTLFTAGIRVAPNNSKLYNNIGHYHERQGELEVAIEYFKQASQVDAQDIGANMNIARALIQLNHTHQAEKLLWSIKPRVRDSVIRNRIAPQYFNVWLNLAQVISRNHSRLAEAEKLYWEVIAMRRDFVDAYINLGEIYIRQAQFKQAIRVYELALSMLPFRYDPKRADLFFNLGVSKRLRLQHFGTDEPNKPVEQEKLLEEIMEHFESAVKVNGNHKEALINWSILMQTPHLRDNPRQQARRQRLLQALRDYTADDEREIILFNLAITILDMGPHPHDRLQAMQHLKLAVQRKPDFRSALYNLALLLYEFRDFEQALVYLKQLEVYHADYTKALLLMADIYNRLRHFHLSEKVYHKVLQNDNHNREALHNLCVIYEQTNRAGEHNSTHYCANIRKRQD